MLVQPFDIRQHNEHYEGAYSDSAIRWRRLGAMDKVDHIQYSLPAKPVDLAIEVGCGTGAVLAEMRRRALARDFVGVDVADPGEHRDAGAVGLTLMAYDGSTLPFADNSADLVVATHVIEHLPEPRALLREMARICRGHMYIEVPCEVRLTVNRSRIQSALDIGHINGYTPEYFMILLQTAGLKILDIRMFDHSQAVHAFHGGWRWRLQMLARRALLRLSPLLASRIFCYHCGALCVPDRRDPHHVQ